MLVRKRPCAWLVLALVCGWVSLGATTPLSWRLAGAAETDITPEYPIRLSGYGNRTNVNAGISQHLFARALAIGADSEGPAVLVTVDNCAVPAALRAEVVRRLSADTSVQDSRFALMSTHTHCAPMLSGVLPNLFGVDLPQDQLAAIDRYTGELTDHIEAVVRDALARRKLAQLSWGLGSVGFAANRRPFRLQPVDHALPVLRVVGEDGKIIALFTSYACHCTTLDINSIHGDWAGCAAADLEHAFPGAIALVALGAAGDQNPNPRRTLELVSQHGQSLAAEAKRLASGALTPLTGQLECRIKRFDLAFDTLPTRQQWLDLSAFKDRAISYHARKNLGRLDRGELIPTHLPYVVQTWSFGNDLTLVFLAGEVVVDYALRLKSEFDPARLWVNAYANDVPCYIPSRRILDEGGYEGGGAMVYYDRPTHFASDVEERILGAARQLIPASLRAPAPADPMASAPPAVEYPDHSDLLVVRDELGQLQPVRTPADWARRVAHIRANVQQVMGPLPGALRWAPLDVSVVSEERTPHYLRRKVRFTPEPGDRVPAWILIPNELPPSGRAPAMLCLHQTTRIGKDEPAGLGGLDSLHYAHELAERGYVCVVPDYPSFGEYPYDFQRDGARYVSGSMKAIWNNQRAIDLLESLPQADPNRIGVIGHSLGGHNALFTALFDERLKAIVSSCGFTPFHDYYGGNVAGWTSDRYMPRICSVYHNDPDKIPFDFYEILGALAPRGVFINAPLHDSNFELSGVCRAFLRAEAVYGLYGAADRLRLVTPDAPHDFPADERAAAYAWLDSILKK